MRGRWMVIGLALLAGCGGESLPLGSRAVVAAKGCRMESPVIKGATVAEEETFRKLGLPLPAGTVVIVGESGRGDAAGKVLVTVDGGPFRDAMGTVPRDALKPAPK